MFCFTPKRYYHAYKIGSNALSVLEVQLKEKYQVVQNKTNQTIGSSKNVSSLIKNIRTTPLLKEITGVEESIQACVNIKKLCDQAYMVCHQIKCGNKPFLSDELIDFISLTQESMKVLPVDMYQQIMDMKHQQNQLCK
jgi:hypothetical protein